MKKVILVIFCLFLCSCGNKDVVEKVNNDIIISDINVTSTTINAIINGTTSDFQYELSSNSIIVKSGTIQKELSINDLTKNTKYILKVFNNVDATNVEITTSDTAVLRFGGDTTMSDFFGTYTDTYGMNYLWEDVSALTNSADYAFVNLETSVSERGQSVKPTGFGFRSNPKHLQAYVNAGIDMVMLANNHVLDYGIDAFSDTITNLNNYNIKYVGAGENYTEASAVKYVDIKGIKIGFFDADAILPKDYWDATEKEGGVMPFSSDYYDKVYQIINDANSKCDKLIVLLHWGVEYTNIPTSSQVEVAHKLVDSGADIIIGGHPHVLQGIEYYKNVPIYYSIGNFIFYKNNDDAGLTGLFEIELDKNNIISSKVYPININKCKANLLKTDDALYAKVIGSLNDRSQTFNSSIGKDGIITQK